MPELENMIFKMKCMGGEIAQLIKFSPEFETQNQHNKKPGRVACVCNPSTGEGKQTDPWGLLAYQPNLLATLQVRERPALK